MTETVRVVSDGEELVLAHGEAFRIHSSVEARGPAVRRGNEGPGILSPRKVPVATTLVQYLGFQDTPGRREYTLRVQKGDDSKQYTVWIAQAAFAKRQALLQDGPDICYQKLLRELVSTEPPAADSIAVTDGDLTLYRDTHAPPARRGFSAPRPTPKPETEA
jgi:hypothetical protein